MTVDELKQKVLELMPDAVFDVEYRTGELVIATGLYANKKGNLERLDGISVLGED
jgi:hypothetical protein